MGCQDLSCYSATSESRVESWRCTAWMVLVPAESWPYHLDIHCSVAPVRAAALMTYKQHHLYTITTTDITATTTTTTSTIFSFIVLLRWQEYATRSVVVFFDMPPRWRWQCWWWISVQSVSRLWLLSWNRWMSQLQDRSGCPGIR